MRNMRVVKIVSLFLLLMSSLAYAGDCLDESETGELVAGGTLAGMGGGVVVGILTAGVIEGAAFTLTVGTAGIAATMAVDCAVALCIPIATMIAGGVIGGIISWVTRDYDCAGSISVSDSGRFYMTWNTDSVQQSIERGEGYCEEQTGENCGVLVSFRHCAALARDSTERAFGFGTAKSAEEAAMFAENGCRKNGGKWCVLELVACNDR